MQQPTIGQIVLYQAYGTPGGEFKSVPRAAIVTDVYEDDRMASAHAATQKELGRPLMPEISAKTGNPFQGEQLAAIQQDNAAWLKRYDEILAGLPWEIGVCVLNPQGIFFNRVKMTEEPTPGCANWPPRMFADVASAQESAK